jgi:hypothetical protein
MRGRMRAVVGKAELCMSEEYADKEKITTNEFSIYHSCYMPHPFNYP